MQLHMIPSAISASLVKMGGNVSVCGTCLKRRGNDKREGRIAYDQSARGIRSYV